MYGPPDEIESHPSGNGPYEQWRYHHLDGIGENVTIEFPDALAGNSRLTHAIVQTGADRYTTVSVSLDAATYVIRGRLMTSNSAPLAIFEETATGPRVYAKSFALPPGSYILRLTFQDAANGVFLPKDVSFTVR